ncbi:Uu.00g036040.m01.CDS01 [Anthostomella pinea]|uniref:Uu.00g036040.m01.CDS01 n=1 Tax=Anthostomella pinea TaxID=933095 RepID=A0AAI8V9C6_9PEZI|nr:Uu.00g036040.m01.CDS01 [Anthostomella pinea]
MPIGNRRHDGSDTKRSEHEVWEGLPFDPDDQSSVDSHGDDPGTPTSTVDCDSTTTTVQSISAGSSASQASTLTFKQQEEEKVSKLFLLPQELFDEITKYLLPANILILALANKELMSRFLRSAGSLEGSPAEGPSSWKALGAYIRQLDSNRTKVRGSFLSLLDNDLLDLVYCYKCKVMHDPFVTFKDRAYAPKKASRCTDWAPDHHMPPRATRKLLRTITKRRRLGAEYRYLLRQVNNTMTIYQNGIMSQTSLRIRYRDNAQLLRRQQVISTMDKTSMALWLFKQQLQDPAPCGSASLNNPKVWKICNHLAWDDKYTPFLEKLVHSLCKEPHDGERFPLHTPACFTNAPLDVSKQDEHMVAERLKKVISGAKDNPMDVPCLLGDVMGCNKCTTDFSLDVVPLPQPFHWGFALTTWLDLGEVDFSGKWDSHRDLRPGREYKRAQQTGDICEKFEDLKSRLDFRPRINKLNQERMGNFGWGKRAANGKDKFMTWSCGHSCDPATGMLQDPDPLEKADY